MIDKTGSAISRRGALGLGLAATTATVVGEPAAAEPAPDGLPPDAAWQRLIAGNLRFRTGRQRHPHEQLAWRESLVDGQHPFACVLACADSRVPPELVFDHGLGDLFTVRAAGEMLDDAVIGSLEYAVEHLGTGLIVVLGHESCGAVSAAVELVRSGGAAPAGSMGALVRSIEATVLATPPDADPAAFLRACVTNQARRVSGQLLERSSVLRHAEHEGVLAVIPAVYDLDEFRVRSVADH